MFPKLRSVLTFFKLSFFLLAICLTILNINERYNTNETTAATNAVDMAKVDFPISFSIIVNPGFTRAYLSKGYLNIDDYFLGLGGFRDEHYGWAGHTEEGGIISTVAGNIKFRFCKNIRPNKVLILII